MDDLPIPCPTAYAIEQAEKAHATAEAEEHAFWEDAERMSNLIETMSKRNNCVNRGERASLYLFINGLTAQVSKLRHNHSDTACHVILDRLLFDLRVCEYLAQDMQRTDL